MTRLKSAHSGVELLSPAGCFPSLRAAIKNGADAVYFGLAQLNMRARSRRSFELKDLGEICRICAENDVRSFLALNTVLYDHDLPLCRRMMELAAEETVSAVIVSDMAAMRMAHDLGIECHLSTQLSISNVESIQFYAPYCDRIVLARELSLPMIKNVHEAILSQEIRGKSGRLMELEAFAHGALCVAVSGRCNMSLYTSNASANRGACDQNCRKEYIVKDPDTGEELLVDNNFVMSPNDIQTIDILDQMLASGIQVFKIEGRGRAPEYVGGVTAAYRKALDAAMGGSFTRELAESLKPELAKVYNRGFSTGYYLGQKQGWAASGGNQATHQKERIGVISNVFSKLNVVEVTSCDLDFSVGDEYVIVGNTTGAVTGIVSELRIENGSEMRQVETAPKGSKLTFPHEGEARRGDQLYRMLSLESTSV
ncbi:MAG: peptidase U32 family protein [Planctomycetota bacterium]|jgi:putative protease|nr:peptidase U32 family protein [Planctomycetota bacterium]MDP6941449.1 peptidase U32 family protein [Planctomycetota bacterium]